MHLSTLVWLPALLAVAEATVVHPNAKLGMRRPEREKRFHRNVAARQIATHMPLYSASRSPITDASNGAVEVFSTAKALAADASESLATRGPLATTSQLPAHGASGLPAHNGDDDGSSSQSFSSASRQPLDNPKDTMTDNSRAPLTTSSSAASRDPLSSSGSRAPLTTTVSTTSDFAPPTAVTNGGSDSENPKATLASSSSASSASSDDSAYSQSSSSSSASTSSTPTTTIPTSTTPTSTSTSSTPSEIASDGVELSASVASIGIVTESSVVVKVVDGTPTSSTSMSRSTSTHLVYVTASDPAADASSSISPIGAQAAGQNGSAMGTKVQGAAALAVAGFLGTLLLRERTCI